MTQEEKQLLLVDLCGRLPYGVILNCAGDIGEKLKTIDENGLINNDWDIDEVKPYLRPMSSMTEEEYNEVGDLLKAEDPNLKLDEVMATIEIDWLNKKMFDYRGLIPKALAIAVTKDNEHEY